MVKLVNLSVLSAAALALSACDLPGSGLADAATLHADAAQPELVEERGGDAWCDDFEPGEGGMTDCALRVDGQRFVYFDYLTDADGYASEMVLTQHSFAGATLATSEPVAVEPVHGAPALRDLDGDGHAEILFGLMSGNVNTVYAVWREDADGVFVPAGEVSTYGIDSLELRDGLIIAPSRGSAASYYEEASRFGPDGLERVYLLEIDHAQRHCQLTEVSGAAEGLDADTLIAACESRDWED